MGAELGLLSLSQLQDLAQSQLNPNPRPNPNFTGSWMWNSKQSMASQEDDDSWEVRAFAEDTGNIMGTTWPPRSYTCTFCRREFRSAQALGGHMNVHRRDRARLHQTQPNTKMAAAASSSTSTLLIPTQELVANGGLCLLYSLPNPNALFSPSSLQNCMETPSTLLSITPYPRLMPPSPRPSQANFPTAAGTPHRRDNSRCQSSYSEASATVDNDTNNHDSNDSKKDSAIEELDLELRLGRSSS